MGTEERVQETLSVIELRQTPRDVKRSRERQAIEREPVLPDESGNVSSMFEEQEFRPQTFESLREVEDAVDRMGVAAPDPREPSVPTLAETQAIDRYVNGSWRAAVVIERRREGALVEVTAERGGSPQRILLSIRPNEIRELSRKSTGSDEGGLTMAPPASGTAVEPPAAPLEEKGPDSLDSVAARGPAPASSAPSAPRGIVDEAAPSPEGGAGRGSRKGLRARLPFGRKREK
jgi:hypothetical protein